MNISHFYGFNVFMDFDEYPSSEVLIITLDEENRKALYSVNDNAFINDGGLSTTDKEVIEDWITENEDTIRYNFTNK